MILTPITSKHIIEAGQIIDREGIRENNIYNYYWVKLPNTKEYPFKYLTSIAYRLATGGDIKETNFQSNEGYRNYVENLGFPINFYKEDISFFHDSEISHLEAVGGKPYRKEIEKDVLFGAQLRPLVYKTNVWAEKSKIENFEVRKDKYWQWSGTFKPYLWIRSYRPGDSKKVFFIVGVSGEGYLYCILECLRANYTNSGVLSAAAQKRFDDYLAQSDYKEFRISKKELKNYNWDRLIKETTDYFYRYSSLYDELEDIITEKPAKIPNNPGLTFVDPPESTKSNLPENRTFTGHETDWSKKQTTSKALGNSGEDFVLQFEKEKLIKAGMLEQADQVKRMMDGCGYDIRSFDLNKQEIHIEVKTTTRKKNEPFYFSINEKAYLELFPDTYFLYRLYDYRIAPQRAKCFILKGKDFIKRSSFTGINFEVTLKEI